MVDDLIAAHGPAMPAGIQSNIAHAA